jgi:hypothetical protein
MKKEGKNKELGLPTDKMKKVVICIDVDGTLLDKTKDVEPPVPNERIRELLVTLSSFKNVKIIVWSGSGELWARQASSLMGIGSYVDGYADKANWKTIKPDIAIDDIQDTAIGKINLIVREK